MCLFYTLLEALWSKSDIKLWSKSDTRAFQAAGPREAKVKGMASPLVLDRISGCWDASLLTLLPFLSHDSGIEPGKAVGKAPKKKENVYIEK